jgi:hypothetical protein
MDPFLKINRLIDKLLELFGSVSLESHDEHVYLRFAPKEKKWGKGVAWVDGARLTMDKWLLGLYNGYF